MQTRLLLIAHAATAAMRSGTFPADDPLDARGVASAVALRERGTIPAGAAAFSSPAACARGTALALGLTAETSSLLAELDYGRWRGRRLADIAAAELADLTAWSSDPEAAPHGGESFGMLLMRVGGWLDGLPNGGVSVAVTHASVIRAAIVHALKVAPAAFSRIEVTPLSVIELQRSQRGWAWWPASL